MERLKTFVKSKRGQTRMTQQEFADRAGVSLSFLRALEQGKTNLNMVKVNQVLAMFGHELGPVDLQAEHSTVFDSNNREVSYTYKDKPRIFIDRISFSPTDTPEWSNRLFSAALTVTITCWSTQKKMLMQYQQEIALGQFIEPNSLYPIFEIEREINLGDEFRFPNAREQHEWTVKFNIDGLNLQHNEVLKIDFKNFS